jgi:hypothetical protein
MLGNCGGITRAILPQLESATQLVSVDLSDHRWLTLEQVRKLMATGLNVTFHSHKDPAYQQAMEAVRDEFRHLLRQAGREQVRSLAEVAALPRTTTRIELRSLGDRAAAMLDRFPNLREIAFIRDDEDPFTVTGLGAVAALPKLVQLELNNLPNLAAGDLAVLRQARLLHTLDIASVAVDDKALQVLPELPELNRLLLQGVRTFGEDGARAIGRCRNLQTLDVHACEQLSPEAIAAFGTLTRLENLNLRDLPNLSDSALMGLQHLTGLRALEVGPGRFTSMGLQALTDMKRLVLLQMSGNRELVTSALLYLPLDLQVLKLDECPGIGDDVGPLLRDRFPRLRSLDLGGNPKLTDAALAAILQIPTLQRLGIRDCSSLTAASFAAIGDARNLRELDATRCPCLTDATAAELQKLRPELKITRKVW